MSDTVNIMVSLNDQKRLDNIKSHVASYDDFPKKGVLFRDIFPLFYQANLVEDMTQVFLNHFESLNKPIEAIVGLDSRGFLLGPILALRLGVPFIPVRKAGKLPGAVKTIEYELEYSKDKFEIQINSIKPGLKCIIFDDLLATGGSLKAAVQLVELCAGIVVECDVIIELIDLKGRQQVPSPAYSLLQY